MLDKFRKSGTPGWTKRPFFAEYASLPGPRSRIDRPSVAGAVGTKCRTSVTPFWTKWPASIPFEARTISVHHGRNPGQKRPRPSPNTCHCQTRGDRTILQREVATSGQNAVLRGRAFGQKCRHPSRRDLDRIRTSLTPSWTKTAEFAELKLSELSPRMSERDPYIVGALPYIIPSLPYIIPSEPYNVGEMIRQALEALQVSAPKTY